jgi:hypothetical protein
VATITYTSIYAVFAVTGFFGGSIMNTIGPRWTMTVSSSLPRLSLQRWHLPAVDNAY